MLTSSPLLQKSPHAMPDKKLPLIGPSNLGTGGCFVESSTDITFVYDCGSSITFSGCSFPSQDAMLSPIHSTTVFVWVLEKGYSCASGSSTAGVLVYVIDCSCCKQADLVDKLQYCSHIRPDKLHHGHNLNHMPYAELSPHTSKHITTLTHLWLIWSLHPVSDFSCRVESSSDFSCTMDGIWHLVPSCLQH